MSEAKLRRLAALCAVATAMLVGPASALAVPPEGDEGFPHSEHIFMPTGDEG